MSTCYCQSSVFQDFEINSEFYNSLPKKHVIRTLMEEHQVILTFCNVLEDLVDKILKKSSINSAQVVISELQNISGHLMRTEKHHIREENTFIRRLVANAEYQPSQLIRQQHDKLGVLKRKLERTIYGIYTSPIRDFHKAILPVSAQLIELLKNHINIEETVLYPQAMKLIPGEARWDKMSEESDNIGYCCFTPEAR